MSTDKEKTGWSAEEQRRGRNKLLWYYWGFFSTVLIPLTAVLVGLTVSAHYLFALPLTAFGQPQSATAIRTLAVAVVFALVFLVFGPIVDLLLRRAARHYRGRQRKDERSFVLFLRSRFLETFEPQVAKALAGRQIVASWLSSGVQHLSFEKTVLVPRLLALGLLGIACTGALIGRQCKGLDSTIFLLPSLMCLMYLLTPNDGVIVDGGWGLMPGIGCGLPVMSAFILYAMASNDTIAPPFNPDGYVFFVLVLLTVARGWWSVAKVLRSRILVKTDDGWFVVAIGGWRERLRGCTFGAIDLALPVVSCDPSAPLQFHHRLDGIHLEVPVQGGGTVLMLLDHEDEVDDLIAQAPATWRDSVPKESVPELPSRALAATVTYFLAAIVACGPFLVRLYSAGNEAG